MDDDIDKFIRETNKNIDRDNETIENHWFTRLKKRVIGLEAIATFLYTVFSFVRKYIAKPFWSVVSFFWGHYQKIWKRFAYVKNEKGKTKFSKTKGMGVFAASLVALFVIVNMGFIVKDFAIYAFTMQRDEVVYLSNAQEIDPDNNIHSVQGCIVEVQEDGGFSCSTENSLYFRIDPTLFSQLWYITNRGDFFYPDYIAATIAPGWQECTITSYGFRAKLFIRRLEIYPELLSVDCQRI